MLRLFNSLRCQMSQNFLQSVINLLACINTSRAVKVHKRASSHQGSCHRADLPTAGKTFKVKRKCYFSFSAPCLLQRKTHQAPAVKSLHIYSDEVLTGMVDRLRQNQDPVPSKQDGLRWPKIR